ncbi:hypothetical protein A5669_18020 [Mycolicibacterium fortuitum]|nr:hypothetical protein A5669_18020 [Mycolicibacterium fortuitum]
MPFDPLRGPPLDSRPLRFEIRKKARLRWTDLVCGLLPCLLEDDQFGGPQCQRPADLLDDLWGIYFTADHQRNSGLTQLRRGQKSHDGTGLQAEEQSRLLPARNITEFEPQTLTHFELAQFNSCNWLRNAQ